jgi:hypothetical protein
MTSLPEDSVKEFRIKDGKGNVITYKKGDVVHKNGKNYRAIRNTKGFSPEHGSKGGWSEVTNRRITKFNYNDTPPEMAFAGDEWFDSDLGKYFKYVVNATGGSGQWVEV